MNAFPTVPASSELWSLMAAQCDGTMTVTMWERLSQLLCDDPNARLVYVLHMDQHATLLWRRRDGLASDSIARESLGTSPATRCSSPAAFPLLSPPSPARSAGSPRAGRWRT